ncbi:MAG: hypothetical protein K9G70_15425 [Prolixibacteraceae bacterium]|nr:hypothetical protein [Prolixibacteraceae bacterium]
MNYFKALGILFGLAAMLKPVYMHLIVAGMLTEKEGKKIVLIDIVAGLFGLIVIVASLLIY